MKLEADLARTNSAGPGPLRCRLAAVRSGLLASVDRRHPAMQPGKAREVALQQLHVLAVLGGEGVELVTQRLDIRRDAIEVAPHRPYILALCLEQAHAGLQDLDHLLHRPGGVPRGHWVCDDANVEVKSLACSPTVGSPQECPLMANGSGNAFSDVK